MRARHIVALVILALVVLFTLQNTEPTRIALLFWTLETPRAVVILVVLAAGFLGGWILGGRYARRR